MLLKQMSLKISLNISLKYRYTLRQSWCITSEKKLKRENPAFTINRLSKFYKAFLGPTLILGAGTSENFSSNTEYFE